MKVGNISNFYQEYITFIMISYPQFTPQNCIATKPKLSLEYKNVFISTALLCINKTEDSN